MIPSHDQLYTYTCGNIFNTIKTSGHNSLEKYTSHFIRKGCVWEVNWRPNKHCNILTPQLFWLSQPFFPVPLGCSNGGLGAKPLLGHGSHSSIFTTTDLNFLSPGLYNKLTSSYFLRVHINTQFNPSTVKVIPRNLRPVTPVFYTGAFLILTTRPGPICNS